MKPFHPIKPGDLLQEELDARGWSQGDLATILQRPVQAVNEIITGKKAITAETARALGAALGTTPRYWLNLEASYRLDLLDDPGDDAVARRARLYEYAPVSDMLKRGWIKVNDPRNLQQLEKAVCGFFEVGSVSALQASAPERCRARKSDSGHWTPAQSAWIVMVERQARKLDCPPFRMKALEELAPRIGECSRTSEGIGSIPELLRQVGVRLVLVETFPRTKIDGVAFMLDGKHPVIGLSIRFKRIDYFFFTLLHEVMHLLNRDVEDVPRLDVNILEEEVDQVEQKANAGARDLLIPPAEYKAFVRAQGTRFSRTSIESFAAKLRIHPAIVIGRLHFEKALPYSHLRAMLGDVREPLESEITR